MKDDGILVEHSYDPLDVLLISKVDDYKYTESVELTNDVYLDFDKDGEASALEILNASKVFGVNKFSLNIGPISMAIGVSEELICVKLQIGVLVHNKELIKSLNHSAINAPPMTTELATT
jgi:uncharacterized protein YuzE